MEVKIETTEGKTLLSVSGRLDTLNSEEFAKEIQPIMQSSETTVVIDCRELEYISSAGLRQFLTLLKSVQSRGREVRVENMNEQIRNIFDITGFTTLFKL